MSEHETISEFNSKILAMANHFFTFGKPISKEEIYNKILSSVHHRYHPKILAIEEYVDMSTITIGSLIGKSMVYETNYLNLNLKRKKRVLLFRLEYKFLLSNQLRMMIDMHT